MKPERGLHAEAQIRAVGLELVPADCYCFGLPMLGLVVYHVHFLELLGALDIEAIVLYLLGYLLATILLSSTSSPSA